MKLPSHDGRRRALKHLAAATAALGAPRAFGATGEITQPFANGVRQLVTYPQKRPMMLIHARPPHLETPFSVFDEGVITPNDAFFVRYHLANIPLSIDPDTYRLNIRGKVRQTLSLSLADIKAIAPPVSVVAVKQCSGNSRGFSQPRVFGSQLGNGSMGNAKWTGVPLAAVLKKAGVLDGAVQVTFNGLDKPVLSTTPDFVKALTIDLANHPDVLLAWAMNDRDLPMLNGYPLKLIVPGYFGTYWVKHLADIEVLDKPFAGHDAFFMTTAYRVPDNACWCVPAGSPAKETTPISRLRVRSFVTSVADGARAARGTPLPLKGIAFDGGSGIRKVELSFDDGATWKEAELGEDLGKYSFRGWSFAFTPETAGAQRIKVRATNNAGDQQPTEASWNPAGYARNVIETVSVVVA